MQRNDFNNLEGIVPRPDHTALDFRFNWLTRLSLALLIALFAIPCLHSRAYAGNWDIDANGTPVFYVDNNPNITRDSNAPPGSARNRWRRIGDIDWTSPNGVEAANQSNQPGQMHRPTSDFTGAPWTVIVNISGGSNPSGYQVYDNDPLVARVENNPYINYAVVRREPGTGQVILRGRGSGVGIDLNYQSGLYIIGAGEISNTPDVLPPGRQGILVCNWGVGMYVASAAYINASGIELCRNHVGIMCAHQADLSFLGLPTSFFTPNNDEYYGPLGTCAGAGVHLNNVWIRDNWDPVFRCQMFVTNSIYSNSRDPFNPRDDRNYPSVISCIVSDTLHPGQTTGILNQNAFNQSSDPSFYYYWFDVFGPGLQYAINTMQDFRGTSNLGCLFLNNDVALHKGGQSNNYEVANCVFVQRRLNDSTGTARVITDGQETIYDWWGSNSMEGGSFLLSGTRPLNGDGTVNDLSNVEGNTVILGRLIASRFNSHPQDIADGDLQGWMQANFGFTSGSSYPPTLGPNSPDPAAWQDNPRFVQSVPPDSYGSAVGVGPGAPIPSGFPDGFDPGGLPGGGSPGGGSGVAPGNGKHHGGGSGSGHNPFLGGKHSGFGHMRFGHGMKFRPPHIK